MKKTIQPEFQDFLISRSLVAAKSAPFYVHNKEKESRNLAKMVIIFYDPLPKNVILCYWLPLEMLY
jgi:hypothetical protein